MAHTKEEWRQRLSDARRALDAPLRAAHSRAIAARIAARPEFTESAALLVYSTIGAEVDTTPLVSDGRSASKVIYRPSGELDAPRWLRDRSPDDSDEEIFSVAIPRETRVVALVPGMGFDLDGVRLGRGGGFYDRALAALRNATVVFVIGVAFEAQVEEYLPRDAWDQRVDLIVTERRSIVPRTPLSRPRASYQVEEVREP